MKEIFESVGLLKEAYVKGDLQIRRTPPETKGGTLDDARHLEQRSEGLKKRPVHCENHRPLRQRPGPGFRLSGSTSLVPPRWFRFRCFCSFHLDSDSHPCSTSPAQRPNYKSEDFIAQFVHSNLTPIKLVHLYLKHSM